MNFAIASRTPETRLNSISRKEYEAYVLDLLTTVFGLRHTLKTKVGDDYVHGISGGERKRVSIAEALAARASIYCWDNATRGLDASTALEYTEAIRATSNIMGNIGIVAIYQASENIYNLFDKVTVLYAGRQVYFGTVQNAKAYFEDMGYVCPPRQCTSEFLTAITDVKGRFVREGMEGKVPTTAEEFEAYWHKSSEFQQLIEEIDNYNSGQSANETIERFNQLARFDKMKHLSQKSPYTVTYIKQLKLTALRGVQRILGNKAFTITKIFSIIIQGLIIGSLYYDTNKNTSGAFSRAGILFLTLMMNSLSALAEIPNSFSNRLVVMKQKGYSFYHPSAEALQSLITDFPTKLIMYILYGVITYFLAQLQQDAGKFFFYLLTLTVTAFGMHNLFQMISSWTKTADVAISIGGLIVVTVFIYAGYIIPLPDMHPWFKWISYLHPLRYGFEGLMANEFHGFDMPCDLLVPSGPGYENVSLANQVCAFTGGVKSQATVDGAAYIKLQYTYSWSHAWRNIGINFAFLIGFAALMAIGTEFFSPVSGGGDVLLFKRGHLPEGEINEKAINSNQLNAQTTQLHDDIPDIYSWQNINYTVPVKGGSRQLLNNVQGYVKPGTLTALMGESGAGKTTLLNVLAQRISMGVISGKTLVNGRQADSSFKRSTGYVQQQDLHLAESTVREALQFSARLRRPASIPDAEKLEYVEKVIDLLGMSEYAEAFVGKVGRGLNVEQRKKLSIGVELAAKPSLLLFLDEPTSGLDSQSAWGVIALLKDLAAAGQSILCTIHQPSATLFEEFDRLLLLKKGGQTVYFGDIGKNSSTLISYFERHGSRKCESFENPAEYILECIGAGASASVQEDWGKIWEDSTECLESTAEINALHDELQARPVKPAIPHMTSTYAVGYFTQLKYVFRRTSLQFWRSPHYILAKLMLMIMASLFTGFTFWKLGYSLVDLQGALFGAFLSIMLTHPLSNAIAVFAEQSRDLYEAREASSNTFHWSTLLLSQFLSELPYSVVFSVLLSCCFYFPIGYATDSHTAGYFFFIYCFIFQFFYVSFALAVLYVSPNASSAAIITTLLFSFMIAFCGVTQPVSQMPTFWTFMYKVSPHTYFVQSLVGVVLHNRPVVCKPHEFNFFQPPSGQTCEEFAGPFVNLHGGYLQDPSATSTCGYCRYKVADEFLARVGIKYSYRWRNVGFFFAYILFNLAAMLFLYWAYRVKVWSKSDFRSLNFFSKSKKEVKKEIEQEKSVEQV